MNSIRDSSLDCPTKELRRYQEEAGENSDRRQEGKRSVKRLKDNIRLSSKSKPTHFYRRSLCDPIPTRSMSQT